MTACLAYLGHKVQWEIKVRKVFKDQLDCLDLKETLVFEDQWEKNRGCPLGIPTLGNIGEYCDLSSPFPMGKF